MDVSIILVNWNTRDLLKECISSIFAQTKSNFEIFVVDNASDDESAQMVRNYFPTVKLIENSQNLGFAAATNQAINVCQGKYIFLLNPDTKILDHAIDKLIAILNQNDQVGLVACKLLNRDFSVQTNVGKFYSFWNTLFTNPVISKFSNPIKLISNKQISSSNHVSDQEIDWARSSALMIRKRAMDQAGYFDEQFYIYGEELDLCWRLKHFGWKLLFHPNAEILHYGKASSNQRKAEMFIQNNKSFYIFLKKNYPLYSYYLFRTRNIFYMFLKILGFSLLFNFKHNKDREPGLKLCFVALKWHFSKNSLIKVQS